MYGQVSSFLLDSTECYLIWAYESPWCRIVRWCDFSNPRWKRMYSIINIKDKSKDRSRAFACTKVLFIMIMCNFTDRVRGEGEITECSVRSRPEQSPESDAGKLPPCGTGYRLHRQVKRLNIQSSEVGPLTILRRSPRFSQEGKPGNTLNYTMITIQLFLKLENNFYLKFHVH